MIPPPAAASTRRTRLPRYAPDVVIVAVGVVLALVTAWMFIPYLSFPSSRLVGWQLPGGLGAPGVDSSAQTTMVIPMSVDWPPCAPMWTGTDQSDDSWLGTPGITYTPWSVTITMHMKDSFIVPTDCSSHYFSGLYVPVQLSEPLGGRALFDGSTIPPGARPYP